MPAYLAWSVLPDESAKPRQSTSMFLPVMRIAPAEFASAIVALPGAMRQLSVMVTLFPDPILVSFMPFPLDARCGLLWVWSAPAARMVEVSQAQINCFGKGRGRLDGVRAPRQGLQSAQLLQPGGDVLGEAGDVRLDEGGDIGGVVVDEGREVHGEDEAGGDVGAVRLVVGGVGAAAAHGG